MKKNFENKKKLPLRLFANFPQNFINNEEGKEQEKLTPIVKKLKGILKNKNVTEGDYKKYLENKYL